MAYWRLLSSVLAIFGAVEFYYFKDPQEGIFLVLFAIWAWLKP